MNKSLIARVEALEQARMIVQEPRFDIVFVIVDAVAGSRIIGTEGELRWEDLHPPIFSA